MQALEKIRLSDEQVECLEVGELIALAGKNAGIGKDGRRGHYNGDVLVIIR